MMPSKVTLRRDIPIETKLQVVEQYKKGEKLYQLERKTGFQRSQIKKWAKNEAGYRLLKEKQRKRLSGAGPKSKNKAKAKKEVATPPQEANMSAVTSSRTSGANNDFPDWMNEATMNQDEAIDLTQVKRKWADMTSRGRIIELGSAEATTSALVKPDVAADMCDEEFTGTVELWTGAVDTEDDDVDTNEGSPHTNSS